MGITQLRLVAPAFTNFREAAAMAVHAGPLLKAATTYPSLKDALHDRVVAIGTTARSGQYRGAAKPLRRWAEELATCQAACALVFGPEDHGLTNEEIKLCNGLLTIPTAPEYTSINLAQAVMVVAWELFMAGASQPRTGDARQDLEQAQVPQVDSMVERLKQALLAIGFLPSENPDHIMFALRGIFARAALMRREVDILNGVARQISWFANGGYATAEDKRQEGKKLR